ncbi:MAG: energy transducer TonB, partial [Terriglobales bacterium]
MFEDSLIESTGRIRTRTGWTTMMSFGIQALIIGVLVLIPLIYTEALPKASLTTFLVAPPPPPPP